MTSAWSQDSSASVQKEVPAATMASKNIIAHLGTQVFKRVKVGVGEKPKGYDLADYVLSRFPKDERVLMEEAFERPEKRPSA